MSSATWAGSAASVSGSTSQNSTRAPCRTKASAGVPKGNDGTITVSPGWGSSTIPLGPNAEGHEGVRGPPAPPISSRMTSPARLENEPPDELWPLRMASATYSVSRPSREGTLKRISCSAMCFLLSLPAPGQRAPEELDERLVAGSEVLTEPGDQTGLERGSRTGAHVGRLGHDPGLPQVERGEEVLHGLPTDDLVEEQHPEPVTEAVHPRDQGLGVPTAAEIGE